MNYANPSPENQWHHFPLWDIRPTNIHTHNESERAELELAVAQHLTSILSYYADIETIDLDIDATIRSDSEVVECIPSDEDIYKSEDTETFSMINLEPIALEDDGDLVLGQILFNGEKYVTDPGAHAIIKFDEDGLPQIELVVWDPKVKTDNHVQNIDEGQVPLETLQELLEALIVIHQIVASQKTPNEPPLDTSVYPIKVMEPDFLALISQLSPEL